MSLVQLPPPNLLGAPERYDLWRHGQAEMVLHALDSPKRHPVEGAPTGFGKSLAYFVAAAMSGMRSVFLTSTKALGSQLMTDFASAGLIEIRGLNSYECLEGKPAGRFGDFRRDGYRADRGLPMMCDEAPCQAGAFCPRREADCLYYAAYRRASMLSEKLIVTNYAYFMSIMKYGEGMEGIDILWCDEAHNALDEVGGFVGTELRPSEVESVLPGEARVLDPGCDQTEWIAWAGYWAAVIERQLEAIKLAIKESERTGGQRTGERLNYGSLRRSRDLKRLQTKMATIAGMKGEWVIDWQRDSHDRPLVKFDPVQASEYTESVLFHGIKKVVLVSATVRPETAWKLGCDPKQVDFREYKSPIPVARRPVIYSPVAQMNRNVTSDGKRAWSRHMDQIIARRLDRKGIIHTISYPRAREVYAGSEYKEMMLMHDNTNTREVIERFKLSTRPLILVSPVLDTGYDFPYDQAEYQIISKMPFPVTTDKVVKARSQRDKSYKDQLTATKLMQMAGRINRAEDDSGETIIIDADFGWWYRNGERFLSKWFKEAIRTEQILSMPLPKLAVRGKYE